MRKYFDILVIPQGKEPSHNIRMSTFTAKIIVIAFGVWILLMLLGTIFLGKLTYRATLSDNLERENENLRNYNAKVVEIEKSHRKNIEIVAKIAKLAGVKLEDGYYNSNPAIDSAMIDSLSQELVSGWASENVPLTKEDLEKIRTPQGRPLYGWITRGYKTEGNEIHKGVDIAVKEGTPVVATATGEVVFAGWDDVFGNLMIIDHGKGYKTVYGHMQKIIVEEKDKVYKGDVIALSGNTGRSSAPHLHYEVRKGDEPVDPLPYLE